MLLFFYIIQQKEVRLKKLTSTNAIIKKLREENHLKQEEVAKYLGISQQAYSYYELAKRELPTRHVITLARLYKVTTDFILCVSTSRTGSYDLNVDFVQGITMKDILIDLKKMDPHNRKELIKYIKSLNSTPQKRKSSKKRAPKNSPDE